MYDKICVKYLTWNEFFSYSHLCLVFAGPVRWTGKKTEIELNPTAKDQTTGCGCTNSEFFRLLVATFVEKSKNRKKPVFGPIMCWTLLMHIFPNCQSLNHKKTVKNWLRYSQKHFYMQLECMSLLISPYLSQILTKSLETLTSLQGIKISIHICNLREVIWLLFGTINFTTKNRLQLIWTSFFRVADRLGPVFKGPVAVPEYLKRSRLVAVASCLVLREKNWT